MISIKGKENLSNSNSFTKDNSKMAFLMDKASLSIRMAKFLKDLSNKISEYSEDIVFQMVLISKGLLKIICLMETDNFIGQTE
jgi:hypothetical protein